MKRLYTLTLISTGLALCIFFFKSRQPTTVAAGKGLVIPKEWLAVNQHPKTPAKDVRAADQTFLTYPEWYLVFSPAEQADYFQHHTATSFPYMAHTAQIWQSYKIVNDQIKDHFPVNTGYHFMIWVIGTSASAEYSIKAMYETLVGRITDTGTPETEEDRFYAAFTQEYVDFIKDRPWYEFNFKRRFNRLSSSIFGEHFFRKTERKYVLTTELLVKWIYGKLIGMGTQQIYEVAKPTTAVVLDNDSLVYLPRYDKFVNAALETAVQGHSFQEIAGNNSAILLTVLVPADRRISYQNSQSVFEQPLASQPATKRVAFATPVTHLHEILLQLKKENVVVEHVFDY